MRRLAFTAAVALGWMTAVAAWSVAQESAPPKPTPGPADAAAAAEPEEKPKIAFRPIESNVIINLPSVDVPTAGTLTFLVTHRFNQALSEGNIYNFFTLDSGNTWGFGLWYAPFKNLNLGFYRTSQLATYEASVEYELPKFCGFGWALRGGADWRTETFDDNDSLHIPIAASPRSSLWAQLPLAYSFGEYVRITAVPTYLQRTNSVPSDYDSPVPDDRSCKAFTITIPGRPPRTQYSCSGLYADIFNVPVGVSIAITHSITVHGEVTPSLSKVNSSGVAWAVSVEKSLLRHRFAFFVGNQRSTTVDQYTSGVPFGSNPKNVYIGFNLYRAWKLN